MTFDSIHADSHDASPFRSCAACEWGVLRLKHSLRASASGTLLSS